ncbi:Uma2 family endonuclease [Sphingomonas sp. BIUV-7]|uniref:Uma2 family endonuclease n=1 Tax=Sphingomonas natans TaxID=3063330 RepID=A0ABT8YF95_9SPHN|nr:Uma2 family endonuclease [Sphingomonas sp. BIUV-7]MDO6416652.1 Uma2 family endonuclease [Sphingomonas sp. BIUV-7]
MTSSLRVVTSPERVWLSVENFLLLNDNGAFAAYTKTELIDGEVTGVNAHYSEHARPKSRLIVALVTRLEQMGSDLDVLSSVSVRVNDDSMPAPDIVLTRYRGDGAVPVESVALVVEVSDTTLDRDLGRKSDLYAAAGIPEYWVLDLKERRMLMHEHPDADGYHGQLDVLLGETLFSATIEGLEIDSAGLVE